MVRAVSRLGLAFILLASPATRAPSVGSGQAAGESEPAAQSQPAVEAKPSEDAAKDPETLVRDTVDRILAILHKPDFKDSSKRQALREEIRHTLLGVANMDRMATLTLANFRSRFSEEQYKKFIDLFSRLLFSTYIKRIEEYTDEKVEILKTTRDDDTRAVVATRVITDTQRYPVDYSLAKDGDIWTFYDVKVEGVSLVQNYRTQFREMLVNDSPDKFLERIEKKVAENEKQS
ncbi:MAG: ABC transporter substrate-binding protein [Candidatus Sumerlaeota bacterium]|nr:ABC transporter substrate-binding protein [Candidatus Sumerlaeota bacterium]